MQVKVSWLKAGYCTANKAHALRGSANESIKFYAAFGHFEHPKFGHILFDSGYAARFYLETRTFPMSLYARTTPVFIQEGQEAVFQLKEMGIHPSEISFIIISHFHADHIAGLRDFPQATFICSQRAYDDVRNRRGLNAVRKGFIPMLLPDDFDERLRFLSEEEFCFDHPQLGVMADVFGDGSIKVAMFDGHAKGQIGALVKSQSGPVLFASDAAWLKESITLDQLPHPIVRLFFDSWKDYKASLQKLRSFHRENTDTPIVPTHCAESFDFIQSYLTP